MGKFVRNEESFLISGDAHSTSAWLKIGVIGEGGCGKTSFIQQLRDRDNASQDRTVILRHLEDVLLKVELIEMDLERLLNIPSYRERPKDESKNPETETMLSEILHISAVVAVFDSSREGTLEKLLHSLSVMNRILRPDCDICFVSTKSDLDRAVPFVEADSRIAALGISFFEVNATTGSNITVCLEEVIERWIERQELQKEYA